MKLNELVPLTSDSNKSDVCTMGGKASEYLGYPFSTRRNGRGRHVVIVEDEDTGLAEYKWLHPDGHLGSVTDD